MPQTSSKFHRKWRNQDSAAETEKTFSHEEKKQFQFCFCVWIKMFSLQLSSSWRRLFLLRLRLPPCDEKTDLCLHQGGFYFGGLFRKSIHVPCGWVSFGSFSVLMCLNLNFNSRFRYWTQFIGLELMFLRLQRFSVKCLKKNERKLEKICNWFPTRETSIFYETTPVSTFLNVNSIKKETNESQTLFKTGIDYFGFVIERTCSLKNTFKLLWRNYYSWNKKLCHYQRNSNRKGSETDEGKQTFFDEKQKKLWKNWKTLFPHHFLFIITIISFIQFLKILDIFWNSICISGFSVCLNFFFLLLNIISPFYFLLFLKCTY